MAKQKRPLRMFDVRLCGRKGQEDSTVHIEGVEMHVQSSGALVIFVDSPRTTYAGENLTTVAAFKPGSWVTATAAKPVVE